MLDKEKKTIFNFSDEYIGIISEYYLFKLLEVLDGNRQPGAGEDEKLRKKVIEQIKEGNSYRFSAGYPTIVRENSTNETFIYRMRMLKKIMEASSISVPKNIDDGNGRRNSPSTSPPDWPCIATIVLLGAQTFSRTAWPWWVTLTAVVAYIIRERMKESSRSFFVDWVRSHYYDYKTILRDDLDRKIGESKSFMGFLKRSRVPEKIRAARDKDQISALLENGNDEEIIYSKKRIKLRNASCQPSGRTSRLTASTNCRFNMSHSWGH